MTPLGRMRSGPSLNDLPGKNARQRYWPGHRKHASRWKKEPLLQNTSGKIAMNGNVVLDSGIIAAIFFPETISGKAIALAERYDCTTVDLAYSEVANVGWKRAVYAGQDREAVKSALDECLAFIRETCEVIPAQDLVHEACDLACSHRITIYDALFLAGAVRTKAPLVTADTKLHTAAWKIVKAELVR